MRAHLHDLRAEVDDQDLVDGFAADWRRAVTDRPTVALLEYTEKLTSDPSSVTGDDVDRLRAAGWDDRGITDAAQVIAYFNYINRLAEGLGVDPEEWIDEVGREIDQPDEEAR